MQTRARDITKPNQQRSIETQKKILDAAEELFSNYGFHGTSLRGISSLAGVRLSLTHYHFGSKGDIFQAAVDRRAEAYSRVMVNSLEDCCDRYGEEPIPLEGIIKAYVAPCMAAHGSQGPGWRNYTRLMSHLASESSLKELKIQFQKYDAVRETYIEELKRSVPDASDKQIHWGFHFLQTALIHLLLDTEAIDYQSRGICDSSDIEEVIEQMQSFFGHGFTRTRLSNTGNSKTL